jgi:hypothetical protein
MECLICNKETKHLLLEVCATNRAVDFQKENIIFACCNVCGNLRIVDLEYTNYLVNGFPDSLPQKVNIKPSLKELKQHEYTNAIIDVNKFEKLWKKSKDYVGYAGNDNEENKYYKNVYFLTMDTKKRKEIYGPLKPSTIYVTDEVRFADGRHRFAVLRDLGAKKIPVFIDNESKEKIKETIC